VLSFLEARSLLHNIERQKQGKKNRKNEMEKKKKKKNYSKKLKENLEAMIYIFTQIEGKQVWK
jgi:hypothetical protein